MGNVAYDYWGKAGVLIDRPEYCPDCGREWPSKFGTHNCNHHKAFLHNNALVMQPGEQLSEMLDRLTGRMESEVCRSAEYADLAGEGDPYRDMLRDVDHAIGMLKRFRRELQVLSGHEHRWNDDDYCSICGRDGRS